MLPQAQDADGTRVLWLYGDGAPAEGTVGNSRPTGITADFTALDGDSGTAVISYPLGNKRHLALVDLARHHRNRVAFRGEGGHGRAVRNSRAVPASGRLRRPTPAPPAVLPCCTR